MKSRALSASNGHRQEIHRNRMKTVESTSRRAWRRVACVGFAAASGCAQYHAQLLTVESVEQRLATPDPQAMRVAAADLRHPVLRPVDINLQAGVSPDEVAVLAVIVSPALRAERDRRSVADAQVLQAGLLPNPQLSAGVDQPFSGPDDFTAYSIGADWEITSLIGRKERRAAATAEAASVELDIAWKEWQTAEAAKAAACDVLAVTTQLEQLREIARQMTTSRDLLRRAVESGEKTTTDLAAAEAEAGDARQAVVAMEADRRRAVIALNRAVGLPPDARTQADGGRAARSVRAAPFDSIGRRA
jgi:outer membrane protein TolC